MRRLLLALVGFALAFAVGLVVRGIFDSGIAGVAAWILVVAGCAFVIAPRRS